MVHGYFIKLLGSMYWKYHIVSAKQFLHDFGWFWDSNSPEEMAPII